MKKFCITINCDNIEVNSRCFGQDLKAILESIGRSVELKGIYELQNQGAKQIKNTTGDNVGRIWMEEK